MSDELCNVQQPGVDIRPRITSNESKLLLETLYGLHCTEILELNAYDDRNYKITAAENCDNQHIAKISGHGYVFKITNSLDSKKISYIEAQNNMMLFLGKNNIKCPRPIRNKKGDYYSIEKLPGSGIHVIRLLEYIPGKLFIDVPPSPSLFYNLGRYTANLDSILKNFYHTAYKAHQSLWMLESVSEIKQFLYVVTNKDDRKLIEKIILEFESRVLRNIGMLEKGVLHGDINEQNIIVRQTQTGDWAVDAILDFGDIQYSCLLFELAIAVTYMIIQGKELKMAGYVLAGYSTMRTVPDHEFKLLKVCIAARLCQSLVMGTYSNLQHPENKYVLTTQATGWSLLKQLWQEPNEKLCDNWRRIIETYINGQEK